MSKAAFAQPDDRPRTRSQRTAWMVAALVALCAAIIAAPCARRAARSRQARARRRGPRHRTVVHRGAAGRRHEPDPDRGARAVGRRARLSARRSSGFADPVAYFLIGVLTIGLAVSRSGLAERVARFFLRRSRGSARSLYLQLLLAFPAAHDHPAFRDDAHRHPRARLRARARDRAGAEARAARERDHDGAQLDQPARLDDPADRRHHAGGRGGAHRRRLLEPVAAAHERAVSRAARDRLGC